MQLQVESPRLAQTRNRRTGWLLLAVFLSPLLAAALVLSMGWYQPGVTNQGELLQPHWQGRTWQSSTNPTWQLVLYVPSDCQQSCLQTQQFLDKVHERIGAEQHRVNLLLVSNRSLPRVQWLHSDDRAPVPARFQSQSQVLLMDPLGQVLLRYPVPETVQDDSLRPLGVAVLADVKRLLKLSRVG